MNKIYMKIMENVMPILNTILIHWNKVHSKIKWWILARNQSGTTFSAIWNHILVLQLFIKGSSVVLWND